MPTFADRLRKERQKTGMNQTDFGALGGVAKSAQINYEKGERSPGADYLLALIPYGIDVSYLLTGERVARRSTALDERRFGLLALLEVLSPEQLDALEVVLKGLAKRGD